MVVVQQPFAGGADAGAAVGGRGQPRVGVLQDFAGLFQPNQERGALSFAASGREPLLDGQAMRPFRQVLRPEQLAADRSGEDILAGIGAEKGSQDGKRATRVERDGGASQELGWNELATGV